MRKVLKLIIILGLIIISLCGCVEKEGNDGIKEGRNEVEGKKIEIIDNNTITMTNKSGDKFKTIITETEGGILYSNVENDFKADTVIGDNYYATQIADISINFDTYSGETIEIEGFSMVNDYGYTFVGRYSESVICPDCPTGYAYLEYEWHGDEKLDLGNEEKWIKVKGELKNGFDGVYYYNYIDAYSIEVMDEWGKMPTVVN